VNVRPIEQLPGKDPIKFRRFMLEAMGPSFKDLEVVQQPKHVVVSGIESGYMQFNYSLEVPNGRVVFSGWIEFSTNEFRCGRCLHRRGPPWKKPRRIIGLRRDDPDHKRSNRNRQRTDYPPWRGWPHSVISGYI
jgi:hypothetical protein